jgi:hypothetical protein
MPRHSKTCARPAPQREITAQKFEWQALSIERKRLWQQWEAEFGQRPRQRTDQGSSGKPSPSPSTDPQKQVQKPATKTADSRAKGDFTPAAEPDGDATETRLGKSAGAPRSEKQMAATNRSSAKGPTPGL